MSREDAPNFRKLDGSINCGNCKCQRFRLEHKWICCTKYNFVFPKDGGSSRLLELYTCDGFEEFKEEE